MNGHVTTIAALSITTVEGGFVGSAVVVGTNVAGDG